MNLKTFVAESLQQIAEGIKEAQNANTGAWIAPKVNLSDKGKEFVGPHQTTFLPQKILFDVAVAASDETTASGGGGIRVFWMQVGGEAENTACNATVSRIRFELPIVWPEGKKPR